MAYYFNNNNNIHIKIKNVLCFYMLLFRFDPLYMPNIMFSKYIRLCDGDE